MDRPTVRPLIQLIGESIAQPTKPNEQIRSLHLRLARGLGHADRSTALHAQQRLQTHEVARGDHENVMPLVFQALQRRLTKTSEKKKGIRTGQRSRNGALQVLCSLIELPLFACHRCLLRGSPTNDPTYHHETGNKQTQAHGGILCHAVP